MGFRLHKGHPIEPEIRRIADHQLDLAIAGLRTVGSPEGDAAVHVARRHIKKVRALVRLIRPVLSRRFATVNRRMRAVKRMLEPVAEANAALDTLAVLTRKYPGELSGEAFSNIQASLRRRAAVLDEQAMHGRVLETAAALLRAERDRVPCWRLKTGGFRAVGPGLERSVRDARKAMTRAIARPAVEHYHRWRQRVKDLWLQVRLLQGRCGDALAADEQRLEALDGYLGQYRDCALLEAALTSDATLDQADTKRCRTLLHRYQRDLLAEAHALGRALHRETPRQFVKRVHTSWRSAKPAASDATRGTSWQPAA